MQRNGKKYPGHSVHPAVRLQAKAFRVGINSRSSYLNRDLHLGAYAGSRLLNSSVVSGDPGLLKADSGYPAE